MNSQHKLYDYKVAPPAEAWKNIAEELDELQQLKPLGDKLQTLSVAPPALAWNNILENLEEENAFADLSQRLSDVEVTPPAGIWSKIEAELEANQPAKKLAPVKKGNFRWSRYAVAASVIALLGLGIFYMVERSEKESQGIAQLFETKSTPQEPQMATLTSKDKVAPKEEQAHTANALLADAQLKPTQVKSAAGNTYNTTVEKNKSIQGRYIMLMTEDGNVVRMSKKLSSVADCVAGDSESDECNHKIEEWQNQLAKAPVATSPDSFLDLLALAENETAGL